MRNLVPDVAHFMKRNYADFSFRIVENINDAGLTIWLSKRGTDDVLRVRTFKVSYYDMQRDCFDVWLTNLAEAVTSLQAASTRPRDGGRLTQEDAIRGWL